MRNKNTIQIKTYRSVTNAPRFIVEKNFTLIWFEKFLCLVNLPYKIKEFVQLDCRQCKHNFHPLFSNYPGHHEGLKLWAGTLSNTLMGRKEVCNEDLWADEQIEGYPFTTGGRLRVILGFQNLFYSLEL